MPKAKIDASGCVANDGDWNDHVPQCTLWTTVNIIRGACAGWWWRGRLRKPLKSQQIAICQQHQHCRANVEGSMHWNSQNNVVNITWPILHRRSQTVVVSGGWPWAVQVFGCILIVYSLAVFREFERSKDGRGSSQAASTTVVNNECTV